MSTKYWIGGAAAVAQVNVLTIGGTWAGETLTLTVGGVDVVTHEDTTGSDKQEAANAIASAWNNSTNPYCEAVSATAGTEAGGEVTVTFTADVAGVPFVLTAAIDVSGAAYADMATTVSNSGPNSWDTGDNWYDTATNTAGTVPVSSDDVIIRNSADSICWGLDQNAVDLTSLTIDLTFTGRIGLRTSQFATDLTAATFNATAIREYRQSYLKIGSARTELGFHQGPGAPAGSGRIKIDNNHSGTSVTVVHQTAATASEVGLPAARFLFSDASADLFVVGAKAGVGVAVDEPGETSTIGDVLVSTESGNDRVSIGSGTTITSFKQLGGNNSLDAAATVTTVTANGGTLTTSGDYTITTLTSNGGTVNVNHIKTGASEITTLTMEGGTVDFQNNDEPKTVDTVNPNKGTIKTGDHITMTTINEPSGNRSMSIT